MKSNFAISDHPNFKQLKKLASSYKKFSIKKNLKTSKANNLIRVNQGVYFDFSKALVDEKVINTLVSYGKSVNLNSEIKKMFDGKYQNKSENTLVLHPTLRGSINNQPLVQEIKAQKNKINKIANQLNQGKLRGYSGRAIQHLVHIGIGGSEFGVKALYDGLKNKKNRIKIHFISSLDGLELERLLANYPLDQMMFVVVSKSFKSEDTLNNAILAKEQILKRSSKNAIKHHFIGVSSNTKLMTEFGIEEQYQLKIWDWLSGRYSSFSAVAFVLIVAIGMERFNQILAGAHQLDCHFRDEKDLRKNIPVLMALIHLWHFSFLKYSNLAIFPYDALLQKVPMHFQQLIMESLGKKTNRFNKKIKYKTSPLVMGDLGTRSQHAFYQLLYQGKPKLLAHFIFTARSTKNKPIYHQRAQLHGIVQSFGLSHGEKNRDSNHHYPGNLPLIQIALPEVNDFYLGYLFAFYEQMTFAWSILLDINAFDQWGVEYGKRLAGKIDHSSQKIKSQTRLDNNSHRLIAWLNQNNPKRKKKSK